MPDIFRLGSQIAQESAQNPDAGEHGHGHQFMPEHRRYGDQHTRNQTWDVTANQPGEQTALQAHVDGHVGGTQQTGFDAHGKHRRTHQGQPQALRQGSIVAHQEFLKSSKTNQNTGQRGGYRQPQ